MTVLVEVCAGTAALSLHVLGGHVPFVGYMGSKRRYSRKIARQMRLRHVDRVVLVDAGPWGDAWSTVATRHLEVCRTLRHWSRMGPLPTWWNSLLYDPPDDPVERACQFLCLQGRTPGAIPIWHDGVNWVSPTGSRTEDAHQRGGIVAHRRCKGGSGLVNVGTIAARIERASSCFDRVTALHADCRAVRFANATHVYLDPPYVRGPRYAELLPRRDVLAVATMADATGCTVAVSEREPLLGWSSVSLGGDEVLSVNRGVVPPRQLSLPVGARPGTDLSGFARPA